MLVLVTCGALRTASGAVSVALPSLAPVIKATSPAVVNIATRGTLNIAGAAQHRQFQSTGSGVIVDAKQGYIVTNRHVIENASEITVTLLDNRHFQAQVIGS